MATTAISLTALARGTESADILDSDGTVATTPSDGWLVDLAAVPIERVVFKFLVDGSGDTITFPAGTYPAAPTPKADTIVMAASDVRYYVAEPGQHERSDGKILITCTDAGSTIRAFSIPPGGGGGIP